MAKGEVQPVRAYDRFAEYMRQRAEVEQTNFQATAEELTQEQVEKIMTADSEDALFAAMNFGGLTGLKDVENGTIIRINGYRVIQGTLGSLGVYAILDATDPADGTPLALDTGVERILGFLRMAEVLELYPVTVQVLKKDTASGNTMVTFKKIKRPAVPSTAE